MRSHTAFAAVAFGLALVLTLVCGAAHAAEDLVVGDVKRTYELFVPPGAKVGAPLLIVMHGRFGTGAQVRKASGFDDEAARYGFVAAYPDGLDRKWFDARQYTLKADKPKVGTDDVGFILALVDTLAARGLVDPRRVYLAGHSNGAMMALTLACVHAERFAGIAVVGGIGRNGQRGFVASADDTVRTFADQAGCGPGTKRAPVDAVDDGTELVVEDRAGCAVPVARVIAVHGGHGWPGRPPLFLKGTQEIDATRAIARFFFDGAGP